MTTKQAKRKVPFAKVGTYGEFWHGGQHYVKLSRGRKGMTKEGKMITLRDHDTVEVLRDK